MGVLDDAIRQHLELKRQHGAPEEEVQRQEEEALGPARREVPEQPGMEEATDGHPQAAEEAHAEGEAQEAAVELPEAEAAPAEAGAHLAEPAGEVEPAEADAADEEPAHAETELLPTDVVFAPPPPPESPEEDERADYEEDEPAEEDEDDEGPFGADEPFASEPEPDEADEESDEREDVLEDTPDFLEETPEHDRLWFEQKPPRDFDFD